MDGGDIITSGGVSVLTITVLIDRILNRLQMRNGQHPNAKLAVSIEHLATSLDDHDRTTQKAIGEIAKDVAEVKGMVK